MEIATIIQRHLVLYGIITDELADEANDNNNRNKNAVDLESFKYKTNIRGSTGDVARRITDADGNRADNPADNPNYDQNKNRHKRG